MRKLHREKYYKKVAKYEPSIIKTNTYLKGMYCKKHRHWYTRYGKKWYGQWIILHNVCVETPKEKKTWMLDPYNKGSTGFVFFWHGLCLRVPSREKGHFKSILTDHLYSGMKLFYPDGNCLSKYNSSSIHTAEKLNDLVWKWLKSYSLPSLVTRNPTEHVRERLEWRFHSSEVNSSYDEILTVRIWPQWNRKIWFVLY